MNLYVYQQIAEMNTKVKAVRALLTQVESRQVLLQNLALRQQRGNQTFVSRLAMPIGVSSQRGSSGDEYIRDLIELGY